MTYRDVTPAWVRGEFLAAARKRYGVFERAPEETEVETKRVEGKTGTRRRRIVGRRRT